MIRFARLLEALALTPSRSAKLRLLADHVATTPDPDRGWAIAALTDSVGLRNARPAMVRALVQARVDPVLFALSYDYVGDLAETVALIWPAPAVAPDAPPPRLGEVVDRLSAAGRAEVPGLLEGWLDRLDAGGRYALLKLITGAPRVGVSARLAKTALANWGGQPVDALEELWHGLTPPYLELFAWLEGRAGPPTPADDLGLRPFMLAQPLEPDDLARLDPAAFRAEWKWDGIRVQLVGCGGRGRLYARGGDDISPAFPDIVAAMPGDAVLDGELLVVRDGVVAPFSDLQPRLNRKTVTAKLLRDHPAHVRLYDLLVEGDQDLRSRPFDQRRARLEALVARTRPDRMDLSELVPFTDWAALAAVRAGARAAAIEGLMLKRGDSAYVAGRPAGAWYKWKRDPLTADAVLMYAQRGHGKRASLYSDFTFGVWRDDGTLVPVGKAYFGFTDEELRALDRWVRSHTVRTFGPVREVTPALVLEIAFDSLQRSTRHKSGVAMRFPRIHRIRWDKPAAEADRLAALERLLVPGT